MSLSTTSVLVVEDHDFQRRTLVRILRNLGTGEVLEAADGEDALRVLTGAPDGADVVVCDLELPGMDGVELLRRIAAQSPGQAIVIASGLEEGVLDTAERVGREHGLEILGRLAKPITAAALKDAFERRAAVPQAETARPSALPDGPVLELRIGPAGETTGLVVSGRALGDEDLVAAACLARRRLARAGHELPVTVVLPRGFGDGGAPARLAGRAALEGVAPRHLVLELSTDVPEVRAAFEALGFRIGDARENAAPVDSRPVADVTELLELLDDA